MAMRLILAIVGTVLFTVLALHFHNTIHRRAVAKIDASFPCQSIVSVSSGGPVQYKAQHISPDRCKWVVDTEAMKVIAQYEDHRAALFEALKTRALTPAELTEVGNYGDGLNIANGEAFDPVEKASELQEALQLQLIWQGRLHCRKDESRNRG